MANRAAVVIGINYTGRPANDIRPLRYAEADAAAMADLLREEDFAVTCLLGAAADQQAVRAAIAQHSRTARDSDLLLLYFSGHGALDPAQTAYVLPYDTTLANLPGSAIPIRELAEGSHTAQTMLTLLDCCHSGYLVGLPTRPRSGNRAASRRGRGIPLATVAIQFREQVRTVFQMFPRRLVLAACAGNEVARELVALGHGVFTYYVLEHWRYTADVDVQSLVRYVDIMLERERLPHPVWWASPHQGRVILHDGVASRRLRIPFPRNTLFVGRDAELATLDTATQRGETPALVGMAGVGKSQLAAEFAYRVRERYPGGIFWMTMEPPEGIAGQVAAYAGHDGLNLPGAEALSFEEKIAAVRAAWEEPLPRLLIFDNVSDPALVDAWRPRTGGSRVLVTSRRMVWGTSLTVTPHPVRELARPDSLTLLLEPRARTTNTSAAALLSERTTASAADAICATLGDLPLALAVAGAYLEAFPRVSLAHYLERLRAADLPDLDLEAGLDEPLPTRHATSLVATFQTSYAQLDGTRLRDVLALRVLHRAAQCAPEPIPRQLLLRIAEQDPDTEAGEAATGPALRRLAALGLLEPLPDGAGRLHRLLAAFARAQAPDPAGDRAAVEEALVAQFAADEAAGNIWAARAYLEHLHAAVTSVGVRTDVRAAALANSLAEAWSVGGDKAAARPLYERALAIREQELGATHPDTARSLNNLAGLLWAQGDYTEAVSLYERALAIREQELGANHPDTAHSLNNLAWLLFERGDYTAARPLYERALAIREQVLGPSHPATAETLNNLAVLLWASGDFAAARPLFERALAIREQELGVNHPDTASTLTNLGWLLYEQGDYVAAHPLLERALTVSEQELGPSHPVTGFSAGNLAAVLEAQGDLAAARPLRERSLAIQEQAVGPTHPNTALGLHNLALLLQAQKDYTAAHPLYERALAIAEQSRGPAHRTTAIILHSLATLLADQGDYAAARPLYERALAIFEQLLGPHHPKTATNLHNLAALLQGQGDFARARLLYERALAIREQVLGPTHPAIAQSLAGLGGLLQAEGDQASAQPLFARALLIGEQRLGPEHPDTQRYRAALAALNAALTREGHGRGEGGPE